VASTHRGGTGPAECDFELFRKHAFRGPIPANIGIFTNRHLVSRHERQRHYWDGSSVATLIPNFGQGLPNANTGHRRLEMVPEPPRLASSPTAPGIST